MVKLSASLLALTLATSSALASSSLGRIGIVQRDLDQELSGMDSREYLLDARDTFDDLEARGFFGLAGVIGKASKYGRVFKKGSRIIGKKFYKKFRLTRPGKAVNRLAEGERVMAMADMINQFIPGPPHHRRGLEDDEELLQRDFKLKRAGNGGQNRLAEGERIMAIADNIYQFIPPHHRRGLEDDEELWQRDFESEEFFGREYDDFLVERDAFDDLD